MNADTVAMLKEERAELGEFLSSLDADDWGTQSLCSDWTVRDVAAHLTGLVGVTRWGLVTRTARHGAGTDRANARAVAARAKREPEQLVAELVDPDRLGLGFFHPRLALCETVVHHQDIRRALDRPRTVPERRLIAALDMLVRLPFLTGASRAQRQVRIEATDIDLKWGRKGPEVRGPAEALMMALAGRTVALDELSGATETMARPEP